MRFRRVYLRYSCVCVFPWIHTGKALTAFGSALEKCRDGWFDHLARYPWFIPQWGQIVFHSDGVSVPPKYPVDASSREPIFYGTCAPRRLILIKGLSKFGASASTSISIRFLSSGIAFVTLSLSLHARDGLSAADLVGINQRLFTDKAMSRRPVSVNVPRKKRNASVRATLGAICNDIARAVTTGSPKYFCTPTHLTIFVPQNSFQRIDSNNQHSDWISSVLLSEKKVNNISKRLIDDLRSEFGKYDTDLIIPTRRALLVSIRGSYRRNQRFINAIESTVLLAQAQALVFESFAQELQRQRKEILASEITSRARLRNFFKLSMIDLQTVDFIERLVSFPTHLQPHFRKWFRIAAAHYDLAEARKSLSEQLDKYIEEGRKWEPGVMTMLTEIKGAIQ